MEEAHTGIRIEYCFPVDGVATRGEVVLLNDGDYSTEEIEVLFELAMIRYHRRFGEILFRPSEIDWPTLTAPPRRLLQLGRSDPSDLHRIRRIQLVKSARPGLHPSATELVDRLDVMIDEDRQVRMASR